MINKEEAYKIAIEAQVKKAEEIILRAAQNGDFTAYVEVSREVIQELNKLGFNCGKPDVEEDVDIWFIDWSK